MSAREIPARRSRRSGAGTGELLSFMAPFMRPVRRRLVMALALAGASVVANSIIPLRVDAVLAGEGNVVVIALSIAALMVASLIMSGVSRWLSYRSGAEIGQGLSEYVFDHTLDAPMLRQQGADPASSAATPAMSTGSRRRSTSPSPRVFPASVASS